MDLFSGMKILVARWEVVSTRYLTQEEKDIVRCAIVVRGQFGLSLEFFTKMGLKSIPISISIWPNIGYIPDIDKIKVITLQLEGEKDIIYRIEF